MICQNICRRSFWLAANIIREMSVRIMQSERTRDILPHGFMEYWIDYGVPPEPAMIGMRMPDKYVVEMFIDRMSASKNYQKEKYTDCSALEYYLYGKDRHIMHPEGRELLEKLLYMLADEGEDATFDYIRREVLHNKK